MLRVPGEILGRFETAMTSAGVDRRERWQYGKWLRYYLDFCSKYEWSPENLGSLEPFIEKLASKNQSAAQRRQAARAVRLYLDMRQSHSRAADKADAAARPRPAAHGHGPETSARQHDSVPSTATRPRPDGSAAHERAAPLRVRETPAPATGASWVKVLDELRNAIRLRNYSPRTSESYTHWTRRFQTYTRSKPPDQLATEDVKGFLTELAVKTTMIYTHTVPSRTFKDAGSPLDFDPATDGSDAPQL